MPDNTLSTLTQIQNKIRRLTRSPSEAQLTTADINNYVNTFVLYDFPEHLRTFRLRTQFTFICNPYQDEYILDDSWPVNALLYNFSNIYTTIHAPVYIAGYNSFYSQSREQFFGIYPFTNSIQFTGFTGDGVTANPTFSGVIPPTQPTLPPPPGLFQQSSALLQNNVLFDGIDINKNGVSLIDSPVVDINTGFNTVIGIMYDPGNPPPVLPLRLAAPYTNQPGFLPYVNNQINYSTGAYTITFTGSTLFAGSQVNSQSVPQIISLPQAMLFYSNKLVLRPVPDQPYRINFEVFQRPSELLASNQKPELAEWWQYIAYGAAKKIFEDRQDLESVQLIMPEFKQQERLCLRRTLVQQTDQRTPTIFTEQTGWGAGAYGSGWFSGGSSF